ncbi:putative mitochondrial mitochondrial DNA polymerase I protein C [Leptomonas pyrrhocoris]|uniref:Putative mitochondrial mitochondrial DNA polymerase I protein C n=1 Tax=Leptomonas pyrrhocoris TaxID=157538 RepID=A0A0M9FW47_LEPPY|nr:putative mitochondrial mitochondrial DNA polymerase I protein C [Leptomonas pyrrhocoris]KPA77285.1 putative mitochondrial mitochondrial DNA polymerase I protein C [Leptomonas pyrrhocoris]|eukprot:XP_015655724.1 putative mitochondrial mitochondrial DNA polymerase I protein C [Leptomonas pyrrhocoris]
MYRVVGVRQAATVGTTVRCASASALASFSSSSAFFTSPDANLRSPTLNGGRGSCSSLSLWALHTPACFYRTSSIVFASTVNNNNSGGNSGETATPKRRRIARAQRGRQPTTSASREDATAAAAATTAAARASPSASTVASGGATRKKKTRSSRSPSAVAALRTYINNDKHSSSGSSARAPTARMMTASQASPRPTTRSHAKGSPYAASSPLSSSSAAYTNDDDAAAAAAIDEAGYSDVRGEQDVATRDYHYMNSVEQHEMDSETAPEQAATAEADDVVSPSLLHEEDVATDLEDEVLNVPSSAEHEEGGGDGVKRAEEGENDLGEAEEVELAAELREVSDDTADEGATSSSSVNATAAADDEAGASSANAAGASSSAFSATQPSTASGSSATGMPRIGSLLDFESPLNLRLATLTRHHGKAFRAIAVYMPETRATINFDITFEDIASGARLVCKLSEVKSRYFEWISLFRASYVALFVPTLQSPNATLLQNAIGSARPARPPPPPGSYHPRLNEDADHLFFSYTKLREVISHKKKDTAVSPQLLTVTVLNAYAEEWKNFIATPLACAPQAFLLAAFNFQGQARDNSVGAMLNKELLQAQLGAAADAIVHYSCASGSQSARRRTGAAGSSTSAASTGFFRGDSDRWSLIFVSAPARTAAGTAAIPPMQDLLTGQFVEPLTLSERNVIYIIGTGAAAESFGRFPLARKGRCAFSILLQDVESQLGLQRPHRSNVTAMLTQALDSFSRITWMGLMKEETGEPRTAHPSTAFYQLQRRSVQREIIPSFLEPVFAPGQRYMSQRGAAGGGTVDAMGRPMHGSSGGGGGGGARGAGSGHRDASVSAQASKLVDQHMQVIFNNTERLARETALRDEMRGRVAYFMHVTTASVTAARRADNPFSARNGMVDVLGQLWSSLTLMNPPPVLHLSAKVQEKTGEMREFVDPESVLPDSLPLGPPDAPNPKDRAENAVLIGWDIKRILLFLRRSVKLRKFLYNGGRIWCAQYAQYLLKGFNHLHLSTMERTVLQFHDGPLQGSMQPLAKLKLIYETQLDVAVGTRQVSSLLHRMDGLLASMEMELQGLQIVPQSQVTYFANTLRLDHERLEKLLQAKIMDFTQSMDDDVRQRINFRSPQDISTIIYGGGLCRHLGSRFIPMKPTKSPSTSLFPHAVCHVTGTSVPEQYTQAEALLSGGGGNNGASDGLTGNAITLRDVRSSLEVIGQLCKRCSLDALVQQTVVVVVITKVKMGGLLEQISVYCPSAAGPNARELTLRIAIDDVVPVMEKPDVVTVAQLKERIANYEPLKNLLPRAPAASSKNGGHARRSAGKRGGGDAPPDLRNVLVFTNSSYDKLEPLVDTGVLATIKKTIFGAEAVQSTNTGKHGGVVAQLPGEPASLERICFADLDKAFPPPPQGADSFESDFSELSSSNSMPFSAKRHWDAHAKELVSLGGVEGALKSVVSQCASVIGTPRDAFRNAHPLPSSALQGLHGQEQASTSGMLWMVTPEKLHPLLRHFLRGKAASSGADAMERVTVLLSPYKDIDLSFFSALQQLRFTEKKMQLFEEGCLFRAVLPECHDRVHGELCHCVTATGRLSSQSPNLQNIPKEEDLRRLIVSRFGAQGMMIEADYSQLEVVVLAALSRDPRMMQELRENVDFHCLRVSLMTKEPYEDIVRKAKVDKDPQYIQLRQQAKVFSFQRQYGAGVATIATTTGLTEQEVERLIVAEEHHYKELSRYYQLVASCVAAGADRLLRLRTLDTALWNANLRRVVMLTEPTSYFVVQTGSKFDFAKDRRSGPRLKNYPVQGLAGEIVQIMCGEVVRAFYKNRNYGEKAFLVNTVHDCVWVDAHKSVAEEVQADLKRIMGHTQETIAALWPDMKLDVPFKAEIHSGPSLGELSA